VTWFASRSLRERRLILVMLALAALTLLWAGIIRPVQDGLAASRTRHVDAVIRLGETEARVDAVRAVLRDRRGPLAVPLADEVRRRADAAGFTLASLEPAGSDRVRAGIASARPGALTAWLARLEAGGVIVDAASLTPNPDRTVGASLTLRSRGN
jgi:general secretion pathway protein M